MAGDPTEALADVRAAVRASRAVDGLLVDAVRRAAAAGVPKAALARALGVHRATVYRAFDLVEPASDNA